MVDQIHHYVYLTLIIPLLSFVFLRQSIPLASRACPSRFTIGAIQISLSSTKFLILGSFS